MQIDRELVANATRVFPSDAVNGAEHHSKFSNAKSGATFREERKLCGAKCVAAW